MKLRLTVFVLLFSFAMASAQECSYSLELFDTFGDGWNGASIDVTLEGETTNYTLIDPSYNMFSIMVAEGDMISISFNSGTFDNEVIFSLSDPGGNLIFTGGPNPEIGEVFSGTLTCPACSPTTSSSVETRNVRAYSTQIFWEPLLAEGSSYLIEYGFAGFTQGTGTMVSATASPYFLSGLEADTDYEFYFSGICDNGDTVSVFNPYAFRTMIPLDVGVVGITRPTSGCALGFADTITVQIHNFAGAPQSLIPFNFSINGTPADVNHPIDGVYTGVLGTDSTDIMDFDMGYDFSVPGEYEILAWTEMEGDTILQNDTFRLVVINTPVISELPHYQNFEGTAYSGWSLMPESVNSTLELGTPDNNIINSAASGSNAWVTNLTGNYAAGERSYLGSPCFDFSNLTEDPTLDFSYTVFSENNYDALWVEVTLDGGLTWEVLGELEPNWYDVDSFIHGPSWSGTATPGWRTASHLLTNTAGNSDVRVRLVFSADNSIFNEGVGIDNIYIHGDISNDLSISSASITEEDNCGGEAVPVTASFFNHGQTTQSGFDVHFQLNDEPVVTENVGALSIGPGESASYLFASTINTTNLGDYSMKIWATFNDENVLNDTTSLSVSKIDALPVIEHFESSALPAGWTSDMNWYGVDSHNNASANLGSNIYDFNTDAFLQTPFYGPVAEGDTLSFEYRYSLYFDGLEAYDLAEGDSLAVQIAPFCSSEYTTVLLINSDNHITSTENAKVSIDLTPYIGEAISIRIMAGSGLSGSDVWLDIDNFIIGNAINTEATEPIEIVKSMAVMPNPTSGLITVKFDLLNQADADLMVTNILGKVIKTQTIDRAEQGETTLDLSAYPDGIYYLSLVASGQIKTLKVLKVGY